MIKNCIKIKVVKNFLKIAFLALLFCSLSCVRDVDLDQYEELVLTPEAAIDLVYFTISSEDFSGEGLGENRAQDETRLEFLDDDYIQNDLVRADLNFKLTNTFQSRLTAQIRFLSPSNSIQHIIEIPVPPGTTGNPAVVDYIETINDDQIYRIKRSIKVSVEITRHDPTAVDGTLQFESKGFYYFKFES